MGIVQRDVRRKKKRGVGSLFSFLFFSRSFPSRHSTIRTPGTRYFSTNSHRNACYTGYKKRKFCTRGNGYKMFHLKIGSHFTIMYCENNRENSQSKLVIQENNHHINLSQLQVLERNQCIPYPLQDSLQNYKKKTKVHFVLIHSTKSIFFCCNHCFMACLSILNYVLLFSCFNSTLDRSRAAPQKCCFRIVGRNETTPSLFFLGK